MYLEAEFKYERIIRWYETQLTSGRVSPHSEVPSIRQISSEFNLSISSVQRAMRELRRQGLIYSNGKKRFYFSEFSPVDVDTECDKTDCLSRTAKLIFLSQTTDMAAFNRAFLGRSLDASPFIQKCLRSLGTSDPQSFNIKAPAAGLTELRRRLVGIMFDRRVNSRAADIVVTQGDDTALEAVLDVLCDADDAILVEHPTNHSVLEAARRLGLKVHTIETDFQHGIDFRHLEQAIQNTSAKALYLSPTIQVPLGFVMPAVHRARIVELAERYGVTIVEDDMFADLVPDESRPPALASLSKTGDVIYLGSFNRTIASSVSVGWCASRKYAGEIASKLVERSYSVSTLNQQLLIEFLRRGYDKDHGMVLQSKIRRNDHIFEDIISSYFPQKTQILGARCGYSRLLRLPFDLSPDDFETLHAQDFPICDLGAFYSRTYPTNMLQICLCEVIDASVKIYFQNLGRFLSEIGALKNRSAVEVGPQPIETGPEHPKAGF
ncbi:aminotransferase-like domain-containing protein [Aliiroseovarius halocynthiae]|nr:PLP-dependent aminotransferase family protein [Aliiroseovarius halocynthiae]